MRYGGGHVRHLGVAAAAVALTAAPAPAQTGFADGGDSITIALTGDAIITRQLSVYEEPAFLRMIDRLREATVAFTNLEVLFHDFEPEIFPAAQSGGTYMRAHPAIAQELAWAGFDMVSRANNHTMDYDVGGMRATTDAVETAGLAHAGAGENLAEARAPAYVETRAGRVALISAASTFPTSMRAGHQRKDVRGRPGLSPIRYSTEHVVPEASLQTLRTLRDELGLRGSDDGNRVRVLGTDFTAGDGPRVVTRPHAGDLADIEASVRDAKRQANWVIVSSHSHESAGDRDVPADFIVEFARAVVDAGADVFVGHGPHVLRGIEIYRGKPIFYSLGNFIFQNETVELQPADNYEGQDLAPDALPSEFYDAREQRSGGGWPADPMYWESVVAVPAFRDGRLAELRLYPVSLGFGLERPQRGRPMLADAETGRKIIADLQRVSAPYGTRIDYVDGVGVVRIPRDGGLERP